MVGSRAALRRFAIPAPWVALAITVLLLPSPIRAQDSAPAGAIRGIIYDKDFQVPLSGARIQVAGMALVGLSGPDGTFLIQGVPPGNYALSVTKGGYDREVMPGIVVGPSRMTDVRVEMSAEVVLMDEMVITGTDLPISGEIAALEIRETAVAVQDAISSDIMSKAGVSDVAGALKLVVGASVSEGKYATVRGLSDRYTGTTLNGVRIPSADPRRRAVQVDLFPTGTIESLTVTKTFTPDLLGDFTGGGLDIKTRSIPDETLLVVSGTLENNSDATGTDDFLTYTGGGVNTFGMAGHERDMPRGAADPLPALPTFSANPTPAQIAVSQQYDDRVRSFDTTLGTSRDTAPMNSGFSISAGKRFETEGKVVMGLLGSLTQTHKRDFYQDGFNNNASLSTATQGLTLTKEREDSRGLDEVLVGGLLTFVVMPKPEQEYTLRLVYNQSAEDESRFQVQDLGFPMTEQNQTLHYTERMVGSAQLHGSHHLTAWRNAAIDWTGSWNMTRQEEPDVRYFRNTFNEDSGTGAMPSNSTPAQNSRRTWREIEEDNVQGMANFSLPFNQWDGEPAAFKAGAYYDTTDRGYLQDSFNYIFPGQFGSFRNEAYRENVAKGTFTQQESGQLWTDVFLNSERIGLATNNPPAPNQLLWVIDLTGDDVNYTGDQLISAAYAMADLPIWKKLKAIAGVRYETTALEVVPTNELFGTVEVINKLPSGEREIVTVPQEAAIADIDEGALLPSVGLVYELAPHMNVRATWSRTLARPTFRELAPVATEEFLFGDEYVGNPGIQLSSITNYDLRWEWFRRSGEVLAVSVFHKDVTEPIELISFNAANRTFIQPVNYDEGKVSGAEVEVRMPLDIVADAARDFTVGMNATWIDSEVTVPADEQASLAPFGLDQESRRMLGQPENLFNLNIGYDNERLKTSAALFYNLVGETLRSGAATGLDGAVPDVYEEAFATLDFTFSQRIQDHLSIGFKARNLTAEKRRLVYRLPDGEEAVKSERDTPVLYTLTGSWTW